VTDANDIAKTARTLMRTATTAALATERAGPWPYVSLVITACDLDASPILLLSDLAEHTKNILAEPRVSLLFAEQGDGPDVLARGRVTVLGRASRTDEPRHRERFLARHEEARGYAEFKDFHFYKLEVTKAHLIAGFGRIHWVEQVPYPGETAALAESESEIVGHMNQDHGEAIRLYAENLLGLSPAGEAWRMTGIDPEGIDLAAGALSARLTFEAPIADAHSARAELVRLAQLARTQGRAKSGE
jgi:putative heme iron utilization protein